MTDHHEKSDKNSNFEHLPNELKLSVEDPAKKAANETIHLIKRKTNIVRNKVWKFLLGSGINHFET